MIGSILSLVLFKELVFVIHFFRGVESHSFGNLGTLFGLDMRFSRLNYSNI